MFREEGGQVAGLLIDELSQPGALETFGPELDLVLQRVNQDAARRGVFGGLPEGGIRFEQLGRAGVDLAIKSSRERLAQRTQLASTLFNIQGQARQEAGVVGERAGVESQQARGDLSGFLQDIQRLSTGGRERQATGAVQSAGVFQPTIRGAQEFGQDIQLAESARLFEESAQQKANLARVGGTIIGGVFGGPAGAAAGSQIGGEFGNKEKREPLQELLRRRGGVPLGSQVAGGTLGEA